MKCKFILALLTLISTTIISQEKIKGSVSGKNEHGIIPLPGVNIYWLGTSIGTSSGDDGKFVIDKISSSNKLVFSMVGYRSDTLVVESDDYLIVTLNALPIELGSVEINEKKTPTYSDYFSVENKGVMTEKELFKAACCNLSESFETNPSIDASFTDAITGIKQIEMLGLSGIYTQTTLENLPFIRGLISNVGLTYIPGPWIKVINVSKGIGSIVNGFESITGQINVELKKPEEEQEKIFFNLYGDNEKRFEGNLNLRIPLSDKISFVNFLHASSRNHSADKNRDNFYDMPNFTTYNFMQRWDLHTENGWESNFGLQIVKDDKSNGTIHSLNHQFSSYKYSTKNDQLYLYAKAGYVFQNAAYKSLGIQISYNNYKNKSVYGLKNYSGNGKSVYLNFIYQSHLGTTNHKFRTGLSFLYDEFNEIFINSSFNRLEKIPGTFFEYTYTFDETLSLILGFRFDKHNYYGTMITPRFHLRYSPQEDWVFRVAVGRGYRTSNVFTENSPAFVSSRELNITSYNNFGYGLAQEKAWNLGINLTHYFLFNYREGRFSIDFYRTHFENITVTDLDKDPRAIYIYSVLNGAYSNSLQAELNFQPFERFDLRLAYRFLDVKQKISNIFMEKPFTAKNRILLNLAYSAETDDRNNSQMSYDLTIQWFDKKRIPSTKLNPVHLQKSDYSPAFAIVNAQITRTFYNDLDLYIGSENLFDFRQNDVIIDSSNPYGEYFDASLIWGPISGRLIYAGLRYKLN